MTALLLHTVSWTVGRDGRWQNSRLVTLAACRAIGWMAFTVARTLLIETRAGGKLSHPRPKLVFYLLLLGPIMMMLIVVLAMMIYALVNGL